MNRPELGARVPVRLQSWEEEGRDPVVGFPQSWGPRLLARGRGRRQCGVGAHTKVRKEERTAGVGRLGPTRESLGESRGSGTQSRKSAVLSQVCFPTEGTLRVGMGTALLRLEPGLWPPGSIDSLSKAKGDRGQLNWGSSSAPNGLPPLPCNQGAKCRES